ncbi:MAG: capsular polysaccharide biosynthesis protein [Thiolinea sp.]
MEKAPFLTCSSKLRNHIGLGQFLDAPILDIKQAGPVPARAVLAWGRKPSAQKAAVFAKKMALPLLQLEDGFVHSLGQGVLGVHSCSLVLDWKGIYYDAMQPSDLENILAHDPEQQFSDQNLLERAARLIQLITSQKISKYNNAPLELGHLNLPAGKKVLVVDQTAGDMSLKYGLVHAQSAELMLAAALAEHPDATILLKTHPDVLAGKKQGCFPASLQHPRVHWVSQAINPLSLVAEVEQVYVLTSQLGFEALMMGKKVSCFGMPFYAGWGLTDDRADRKLSVFQRRGRKRALVEVFAAAYLIYSRYIDPERGTRCELEQVADYIALQNYYSTLNSGSLYCFGFTFWKQNYIRRFLHAPNNKIHFVWKKQAALKHRFNKKSQLAVWGERAATEVEALAKEFDTVIWRVEDGFIRSVGLGSDYNPPLSLVVDQRGIYYDPNQPSDLENYLQNSNFPPKLLNRASVLRNRLLQNRLSKYNLGIESVADAIKAAQGQLIVLVPGQVEDDVSIRKGCIDIADNTALLKAVRVAKPDAYVIYKPHPDVVSGNRKGKVDASILKEYSDLVLEDASIPDCLDAIDEVHTMTSLVGFEALLRGKQVACYGLPFYAGWGLTTDRHSVARRNRRLHLDELVAATLILYPRYINWQTGAFTTPEYAVELLHRQLQAQGGKQKNKVNWFYRQARKVVHVYHGVFKFRY